MYNFGAETHLGAKVMSAFVLPSVAIAWALAPTVADSIAPRMAHKDSDYTAMFAIVCWCLGAETHPGGDIVSATIIFSFVFLLDAIAHSATVATWRVLIGTSHKTSTYNCMGSLWTRLEYKLVDGNRVWPGIHRVRVGPATRSAVATW